MGHLFQLSEYDRAFARFLGTAINELMRRKDPFFGSIKIVQTPQLPAARNTMPSGEVVDGAGMPVAMPFELSFRDAIAGNPDRLLTSLDDAAEEGLKIVMPQIFAYSARLCEAAGTATHAGGQKISHKLIRESLEKMQINFDDGGQPIMPTMVVSPDMEKLVRELPPMNEDEVRAWNEMIERKRSEFNDRRRYRKLS